MMVFVLVVALVVYPLSVGPEAVLHAHGHLTRTVDFAYWPIIKLSKLLGCKEVLDRYIKWWLKVTGIKLSMNADHKPRRWFTKASSPLPLLPANAVRGGHGVSCHPYY